MKTGSKACRVEITITSPAYLILDRSLLCSLLPLYLSLLIFSSLFSIRVSILVFSSLPHPFGLLCSDILPSLAMESYVFFSCKLVFSTVILVQLESIRCHREGLPICCVLLIGGECPVGHCLQCNSSIWLLLLIQFYFIFFTLVIHGKP